MINIGTCVNYLCNPNIFSENLHTEKKPISVTFCVPGKSFSQGFVHGWTKLLLLMKDNPAILDFHFSNVYNEDKISLMNELLSGNTKKGNNQLPFEDDFECDFLFFIDSNLSFDSSQVLQIIYKMVKYDLDVLTGVYYEKNSEKIPIMNYIDQNGTSFYHTKETLSQFASNSVDNLIEVENIDLNFACIKNKVFEYLNYPWFEKTTDEKNNENNLFIEKIKKSGSKVYCDPTVFVRFDS